MEYKSKLVEIFAVMTEVKYHSTNWIHRREIDQCMFYALQAYDELCQEN